MVSASKYPILKVIAVLLIAVCPVKINAAQDDEFRGIRLQMEEIAHDGTFPLRADQPFQHIDANAVLRLTFDTPPTPEKLEKSNQWRLIHETFSKINSLMAQYIEFAQIAATLPDVETADTQSWRKKVQSFDQEFGEFTALLKQPEMQVLISSDEINDFALRSVEEGGKDFYDSVTQHLELKKQIMFKKAKQFAEDTPQYEVIVRAYAVPVGGDVKRLPVKGYDNLPSRPLRPIQRLSLIPNQTEAQRLRTEYEGAKIVKAAIVEIKNNESLFKDSISELQENISAKIIEFAGQIQAIATQWQNIFDESMLDELNTVDGDKVKKIKQDLEQLNKDVAAVKALSSKIKNLLNSNKEKNALDRLIELQSVAQPIIDELEKIATNLQKWPQRINTIIDNTEDVVEQITAAQKIALAEQVENTTQGIRQEFSQSVQTLLDKLPNTVAALNFISDGFFTDRSKQLLAMANNINPEDTADIPRPLDDLEPAKVELARSGLLPGDTIEVDVGFFRKSEYEQPEKRINYSSQIVLTNWHRRFSGDMIFAKSVAGEGSDQFRPNIGVSMEWHYFKRNNPNGLWNGLDMGFGMHAASLDQDQDQNVELGAGVNVSFFKGLLRVGYGWNLNVDKDREYYWIGFGLFGLLNQFNTTTNNPGN